MAEENPCQGSPDAHSGAVEERLGHLSTRPRSVRACLGDSPTPYRWTSLELNEPVRQLHVVIPAPLSGRTGWKLGCFDLVGRWHDGQRMTDVYIYRWAGTG